MPRGSWSEKRERQYEHIKGGLERSGRSPARAEEIAARTVNKERGRSGEAKEPSRLSRSDISSAAAGAFGRTEARRDARRNSSTRKPKTSTSAADRRCRRRSSNVPSIAAAVAARD